MTWHIRDTKGRITQVEDWEMVCELIGVRYPCKPAYRVGITLILALGFAYEVWMEIES